MPISDDWDDADDPDEFTEIDFDSPDTDAAVVGHAIALLDPTRRDAAERDLLAGDFLGDASIDLDGVVPLPA
jgi:hypothetical protein